MKKPNIFHLSNGRHATMASLTAALLLGGCSISTSASSNTAADAKANGESSANSGGKSSAEARSKGGLNFDGSASASGQSSADASGSSKMQTSAKGSSSSKIVFKTKSRASGLGKAKSADHFKATLLVGGGKLKGNASGGFKADGSVKTGGTAKVDGSAKAGGSVKAGGSAGTDSKGSGKAGADTSGKGGGDSKASAGGAADGKGSINVSTTGKGSVKGGGSAKAEGKGSTKTGGKGASNSEKAAADKGESKPEKDKKPEKVDTKPGKVDTKPGKPGKVDTKPGKDKSKPEKDTKPEKGDTKPEKDKSPDAGSPSEKPGADLPVVVIDPPEAPPENVFGYETPVRGCFEGIVYPLGAQTQRLPTDWSALTGISVVYACEWDIPTRKWDTGFPGVEDHFEWFAIQYAGSFSVATAGKWKFRISSDDGAKLFIDGKLILDNDGVHPPKEKEVAIDLAAGDHEMILEYFQGPRYHINLQLFATPPGGEEGIFSVR